MTKIIEIQNLVKKYNGKSVLKWMDFSLEKWDFKALLWINWAWKSTTIGILTNLVEKTSGNVKIAWIDIDTNFSNARKTVWVVPQEFNFDPFAKVESICINQAWYYGVAEKEAKKESQKLLKSLWLWEKKDAKAKELSWGMKRRLMIARALVHKPKILILDEPTAGVDVELRKTMWDFIQKLNKEKGVSILLTTHYLEEVEQLCNKVAILSKGKIVADMSVTELLSNLWEQTFVINTQNILDSHSIWWINKKYQAIKLHDTEIEITLPKNSSLSNMFRDLDTANIYATSIRPKENRIEKLFLEYTQL